jgi:hypothetical protein
VSENENDDEPKGEAPPSADSALPPPPPPASGNDSGSESSDSDAETKKPSSRSDSSLVKMASELEEWATEVQASDDPSVQQLAEALRTETDLPVWAEMDLEACLPRAGKAETSRAALRRGLSTARSVLVFLPIVLAWLSIRQVTSSYRRYSARNPEQAVDFLSFWSNPSRGIEQLQTVALLIAVIVAAVIAITVFLGSLEASAQARVAEEQLRRERERANIIVKLRLVLTPRRKVDVQSVEASLTAAIEDFRYSSNQLRESTAQLHEIFESTESLGPQLERSTQKMNEIISMMQKDLSGSILGLTSQVQSLGSELTGIDSKLGRSLEERIENVVNMTSGLTRNFDVLAGRLDQVCRAAEASAARLAAMTGAPSFSPQNDE